MCVCVHTFTKLLHAFINTIFVKYEFSLMLKTSDVDI